MTITLPRIIAVLLLCLCAPTHAADAPVILKSGQSLGGAPLNASAKIKGALVESDRYAELYGKDLQWSQDGVPQGIRLHDKRLDGGRTVLDRAWEHPKDAPFVADGIRLTAQGVNLDNVKVANFHGAGVRLWRGNNPKRNGPWQSTDWEATRISSLEIHSCFAGLEVESGADGKIGYIEAAGIRDKGVHFGQRTGAWQIDKLHAFGCDVDLHTEGGSHLISILETETGRIGWLNDSPFTQAAIVRAFSCFETAVELRKAALIGSALITAQQGTALKIAPGANSTQVSGVLFLGPQTPYVINGLVQPPPSLKPVTLPAVVGAQIEADNCDVKLAVYGGQRPIVIPRAVVGLTLDLRLGPGADVGVEIPNGLGPGCKLTIRHRNCKQPFVAGGFVPKGSIEVIEQ